MFPTILEERVLGEKKKKEQRVKRIESGKYKCNNMREESNK